MYTGADTQTYSQHPRGRRYNSKLGFTLGCLLLVKRLQTLVTRLQTMLQLHKPLLGLSIFSCMPKLLITVSNDRYCI